MTTESADPLPRRRFLLTGVFLAVVFGGLLLFGVLKPRPETEAPGFSVELLTAEGTFELAEHVATDGRPLVLNLWASWCAPCRAEIPAISAFAAAHPEIKVIGVAVEDPRSDSQAFADEIAPTYDLGYGDAEFREDYPSIGLPATYIITGEGAIEQVINGIVNEDVMAAAVAELG